MGGFAGSVVRRGWMSVGGKGRMTGKAKGKKTEETSVGHS